jgi:hypothetical protein
MATRVKPQRKGIRDVSNGKRNIVFTCLGSDATDVSNTGTKKLLGQEIPNNTLLKIVIHCIMYWVRVTSTNTIPIVADVISRRLAYLS